MGLGGTPTNHQQNLKYKNHYKFNNLCVNVFYCNVKTIESEAFNIKPFNKMF